MKKQNSANSIFKFRWHDACGVCALSSPRVVIQKFTRFIFISVIFSLIAGCNQNGKPNDQRRDQENTLYLGTYQKPEPFLYPMITGGITQPLMDIVFNRLFTLTTDGRLIPELAEKWEVEEGGRKFIIHLRHDVRFHDGVELTSRDVAFTLNWLRNPELSKRSRNYSEIESIKAIDDHTVEIVLKKPNVNFLWVAASFAHIYPAHLFSETPMPSEMKNFGRHPIGTGQYQFSEWKSDNTLAFTANPGYFEGKPKIQNIVVRSYSSKLHLFNAFVRGDVDFLERLDSADYETIKKDTSFQSIKQMAMGGYALMFNFRSPIASDINIRKAISLSLRRNEIIELMEKGYGEPMLGPFSEFSDKHDPNLKYENFDAEKALALLQASGWADKPLQMKLIVEETNLQQMRLAKIIRNQLTEIGITVEIEPVKGLDAAVRKLKGNSDWDAVLFIFQTVKFDPYHFQHYLISGSVANIGCYESNELEQVFGGLEVEVSFQERLRLFWQMEKILYQDIPICFLYAPYDFTLVSERIRGFTNEFLLDQNVSPFFRFISLQKINKGR